MIQLQDNNDVQFCNTTNLDNELQKNLQENENNDENVTNEKVHYDDSLQKYCLKLESFLKHDVYYDIDSLDLFSKLKVLKGILQIKDYTPIDILNYIKRLDLFPNTCIVYRILLITPVTIVFTERSFSKLKLIKSYLRPIMFQERLSGLIVLLIENEMLAELEYKNLISQFTSQKTKKKRF